MPGELSVPELLEPRATLNGAASVGSEEKVEGVEGVFVGFALALDELIEFGVGLDMAELEGHGGGDCLLCWEREQQI